MMGTTPEQAAKAMTEDGADAVGANCGVGIECSCPICRAPARRHRSAGLDQGQRRAARDGGRRPVTYSTSAEVFARHVRALVEAGASFIGGCCGTTPEFIRALARAILKPCDRLKLIACEVLYREMCDAVARSPHQVDVEFLPKGLHDLGGAAM